MLSLSSVRLYKSDLGCGICADHGRGKVRCNGKRKIEERERERAGIRAPGSAEEDLMARGEHD